MTPGWPFPFFTLSLPFTTTHAFLGKNKHGSPLLGGLSLYKTADVVVKGEQSPQQTISVQ